MIELLKNKYWSKSQAFLLPLTGIAKTQLYKLQSYLFWERYSIEDYFLIVKFTYDNYDNFVANCQKVIFPHLDKEGYAIECYDFGNQSVMVLDISKWASDIEMFLKGKYSKLSEAAKDKIVEYHTYYDRGNKIEIDIQACLEPNTKYDILDKMTPIEYVAETYGLNLSELMKVGEVGGIYHKQHETLEDLKLENEYRLRKEGSALS